VAEPALLLDASAFLALIQGEKGSERVAAELDRAAISAVNLAEAIEVLTRRGAPRERATAWAEELGLPIIPFDAAMAHEAARLLARHRHDGLSLGDAACLATAATLGWPVYTTDWAWSGLGLSAEIRQLR
jgi:PIN domain nuclease of toxin-antitoxin system